MDGGRAPPSQDTKKRALDAIAHWYGEGLELVRAEHERVAAQKDGKAARAAARKASKEQRSLNQRVIARGAAAKLWAADGDAARLQKRELLSFLNEIKVGVLYPGSLGQECLGL
eukprot:scaffold311992_cov30-Tisochrysis_lutea.AAC.1